MKLKIIIALAFFVTTALSAQVNVSVQYPTIPATVNRVDNIIAEIEFDNQSDDEVTVNDFLLNFNFDKKDFTPTAIRLMYSGTMSMMPNKSNSQALKNLNQRIGGSQDLHTNARYRIEKDEVKAFLNKMVLQANQKIGKGKHYFFVSLQFGKVENIATTYDLLVAEYKIDNKKYKVNTKPSHKQRLAFGLRNHNDDGVYSYRIPGLATTNKGTLIAVYDARYYTTIDLQEDIDVGVSRSTDGGRTWEKMKLALDMGEWGGLPEAQNGAGDPCILVDETNNDIYIFALWTHGMGNGRAWNGSKAGMSVHETGQLIYVKSVDDGKTWSEPVNITEQVKDPTWTLLLQGPGRAITMTDGTLVVPIQYVDSTSTPNASIMYSKDKGKTWKTHTYAKTNTTEAQVVQLSTGELMLNMRDNRQEFRSIYTTTDFGKTWVEHPTSYNTLIDPVCMASIISAKPAENILGKNMLIFSNPNRSKRADRSHMTLKVSLDDGNTWEEKNQLLIDEFKGWGYSCLTMIDKETVGIVYEGSTSQLVFQAIKLKDLIRK